MCTGHRFLTDYGKALGSGGTHTIVAPSSGGTFVQNGMAFATATVGAGTYKMPNGGLPMYVIASGSVSITSASSVAVLSLTSGQVGLLVPSSSTTWVGTILRPGGLASQPVAKLTTSAVTTATTPAAGALTGAQNVFWENTADGALTVTTRTASELYADGGYAEGDTYLLTIVNRGNNTVTLAGGTDVTIDNETTIATLVTRTYLVTIAGGTDISLACVSKGTIET